MERTGYRRLRIVLAWALAPAALGSAAARAEETEEPAPAAAEAGVRAAGRLLGAVLEAVERTVQEGAVKAEPKGRRARRAAEARPQPAAKDQRQRQIEQQARQMEQFFNPPLQAELELVRRTCGTLAPAARQAIVASGNRAVKVAARQFAAVQLGEGDRKSFDARQTIHESVAAALKPQATPEEFAAYVREHAARIARRERAARTLIVAKLDLQLDLSAAQREAITADLEKRWEASWIRELDNTAGMRIGNYPLAPDYAAACITPHLDGRQRAEWNRWAQQAGWGDRPLHQGWNLDGNSLQPDPWWKP